MITRITDIAYDRDKASLIGQAIILISEYAKAFDELGEDENGVQAERSFLLPNIGAVVSLRIKTHQKGDG